MHLIDGHHRGGVVYTRLHHSLADGIALTEVLLALTDATPDGDREATIATLVPRPRGMLDELRRMAGSAAAEAEAAASRVAHLLFELPRFVDPRLLGDAIMQAERVGGIARKLLLGRRPRTPLSGTPCTTKRAVWSEPFPLAEIKHVGRMTGTTVNDVLMGAMAGALAAYMREHGGDVRDVYTLVPVNVRPLDKPLPSELGNRFALVMFKYPTTLGTPLERIAETHRRMEVIKHSPEAGLTFGLIRAIGLTGPELERVLVDFVADKAIGVTTNVPGPVTERYAAGSPIRSILSWEPSAGDQTLGISIFTYAGAVRVGFKVDTSCVREPENLLHAFDQEVAELLRLAHAG
jgi:WS/DGAT/MGAT family acyltransferase